MEMITVESAKTLTIEQLKEIANTYTASKVIDFSKRKQAEKILATEDANIELIAFAIKQRAIELGIGPNSDEDATYDDEGEPIPEAELKFKMHEFMQTVAWAVDQQYGEDEYGEGSEDYFWVRSTC